MARSEMIGVNADGSVVEHHTGKHGGGASLHFVDEAAMLRWVDKRLTPEQRAHYYLRRTTAQAMRDGQWTCPKCQWTYFPASIDGDNNCATGNCTG